MSELDPVGLEAAALDEAVESYRHMFAPGVSRESTFRNGWAARAAYLSVQGRDGSELDRLRDGMAERGFIVGCNPDGVDDLVEATLLVVSELLSVQEQPPPRLDRISFESGYVTAMSAVWSGVYPANESALALFVKKAWKGTGADASVQEQPDEREIWRVQQIIVGDLRPSRKKDAREIAMAILAVRQKETTNPAGAPKLTDTKPGVEPVTETPQEQWARESNEHQAQVEQRQEPDERMRVTLLRCGQCNKVASKEAWDKEWWAERSRRMSDKEAIAEHEWSTESTSDYGLDERDVCPHCSYVHSDNEESHVEEVDGSALAVWDTEQQPKEPDGRLRRLAEAIHRLNVDWTHLRTACGDPQCLGDCEYVQTINLILNDVLGIERSAEQKEQGR